MFYDCYTALCQARGISRSRAAQEMGLSNSTVTKWKNTGATPSGETLARVSAYFGVPVGELLGEAVPSGAFVRNAYHGDPRILQNHLTADVIGVGVAVSLFGDDGIIHTQVYASFSPRQTDLT